MVGGGGCSPGMYIDLFVAIQVSKHVIKSPF